MDLHTCILVVSEADEAYDPQLSSPSPKNPILRDMVQRLNGPPGSSTENSGPPRPRTENKEDSCSGLVTHCLTGDWYEDDSDSEFDPGDLYDDDIDSEDNTESIVDKNLPASQHQPQNPVYSWNSRVSRNIDAMQSLVATHVTSSKNRNAAQHQSPFQSTAYSSDSSDRNAASIRATPRFLGRVSNSNSENCFSQTSERLMNTGNLWVFDTAHPTIPTIIHQHGPVLFDSHGNIYTTQSLPSHATPRDEAPRQAGIPAWSSLDLSPVADSVENHKQEL
ncbi:hypothetical protein TI39_contig1053g00002 [Zymoseptoria brevis]|uniref:Uncharacterized protein n=1 Tax=Zymoseptoria brevis TaxID=1047168 RepID=A0A0F4GEI2_9PEZI|nr:hypothetical protein TI39_contig1053g00002 [Zymoseptoria brevis]